MTDESMSAERHTPAETDKHQVEVIHLPRWPERREATGYEVRVWELADAMASTYSLDHCFKRLPMGPPSIQSLLVLGILAAEEIEYQ